MSENGLSLAIPAELVDVIARRVLELLPSDPQSEWLTVDEAAAYLRCPKSRIYALSHQDALPSHRDGSRLLFNRDELREYVMRGGAKRV